MAPQATAKPAAGKQQQVKPRSFLVGTQEVIEGNDYDTSYTNPAAGTSGTPWALQATGWLKGLHLLVTGTGLTAGTVTADGPFNIFPNIQLSDVNNEAIFGPFDGYSAFVTNKYGGYYFSDDPSTNAVWAYTGTVTTNNFTFVLYIPLEIVNRDPLGPVASVNNTATLTLNYTLNAAAVFTTTTGTLVVRVRGTQDFYWQPRKTDKQGRPIASEPPASGTTQYWTQGSYNLNGGIVNQQLITGLGYPFREYLFLNRGVDTTRALGETNWPDPMIAIKFEANMLLSNLPKVSWINLQAKQYGYNGAADSRGAGVAVGKENGLYPLNFNDDFFLQKPGGETRRSYLQTSPGANFIVNGSFAAASTLYAIVNYIAPGGGAANSQNTSGLTNGS